MSLDIRVSGFRRNADCQLTGRTQCDCFVVTLPGVNGTAIVSPVALATWVKNKVVAAERLRSQRGPTPEAKSDAKTDA
jgi:hypothetical protein